MDVVDLIKEWCVEKRFSMKKSYSGSTSYLMINTFHMRIIENRITYLSASPCGSDCRVTIAYIEDPDFFERLEEAIIKHGISS